MSKLDELIQQLCPDGVEYKLLGEVCNSISDGSHNPPKGVGESSYIMISSQNIQPNGLSFDNVRYLTTEDFEKENKRTNVSSGDVLLTIVGTIGRSYVVKENDPKLTLQRSVAILHPSKKINSYFLHYYLLEINSVLNRLANGAAQKGIYLNQLSDIEIPLPPLPVQEEIVRILDTFTESTNNLKEQIQTRRKQYEYYRDQLLDLEGKDGVEMKTLGEIGEFIRGTGIQKADFVEDGFPCIHYGQIHTKYGLSANSTLSNVNEALYHRSRKAEYGDVVLATTSEDAECVAKPVAWLGKEKVAISGDAYIFHHKENGKYMAHLFSSHRFFLFKIKHATGAKVVRISGDNMAKFEFPLPSLQEQHRIVTILDQFEASIANLEAQLKEREKQYEYYRNQLLDFKKKEE